MHNTTWDAAVTKAEAEGEASGDGDNHPFMLIIDFIAELYNGGVRQYIDHGRSKNWGQVMAELRYNFTDPKARELADVMRKAQPAVDGARRASAAASKASQEGNYDSEDEDPYARFTQVFDTVEDWIYNNANTGPILTELASK